MIKTQENTTYKRAISQQVTTRLLWTDKTARQTRNINNKNAKAWLAGHSNLVIYQPIPSKFHAWITLFKLSPKFEWKFCPMNVNKMAAACRFALVDTLIKLFITWFFQITCHQTFSQPSTVGIGRWTIIKMATQMAATCQFECVDNNLTWSFIIQFLPNFINGLFLSIYCQGRT